MLQKLVFGMFLVFSGGLYAAEVSHEFYAPQGLMLEGYDPVSYFTLDQPVKGQDQWSHTHEGAKYVFASKANRDRFIASPKTYQPAYGGWCAYAVAKGKKFKADALNYKITDGRLFVFYKSLFSNTKDDWIEAEAQLLQQADTLWDQIKNQQP